MMIGTVLVKGFQGDRRPGQPPRRLTNVAGTLFSTAPFATYYRLRALAERRHRGRDERWSRREWASTLAERRSASHSPSLAICMLDYSDSWLWRSRRHRGGDDPNHPLRRRQPSGGWPLAGGHQCRYGILYFVLQKAAARL